MVQSDEIHKIVKMAARPLGESEAPALHATLERLSRAAGIAKPELYICEAEKLRKHPILAGYSFNAFALTEGKPVVAVGPHLLQHFTGDPSGRTVTAELEAVIGHELGHLKYDRNLLTKWAANPLKTPMAGMVAGTMGLAIYKYFYEHPEEQSILKDSVENDPMLSKLGIENANPYMHKAMVAGQYMAAAGLGLVAGVTTARTMRHVMEFRADRTAAELMKDSKPMVDALKSFSSIPQSILKELRELKQDGFRNSGMSKDEQRNLEWLMKQIGRITHPSTEQRIERLESMRF